MLKIPKNELMANKIQFNIIFDFFAFYLYIWLYKTIGNPYCKVIPAKAPIKLRNSDNCGTKKAIEKINKVRQALNQILYLLYFIYDFK